MWGFNTAPLFVASAVVLQNEIEKEQQFNCYYLILSHVGNVASISSHLSC